MDKQGRGVQPLCACGGLKMESPMDNTLQEKDGCCPDRGSLCACSSEKKVGLQPIFPTANQDEVCCGSPPGPESGPFERPGYRLLNFVEDFMDTPVGSVPRVKTHLDPVDHIGNVAVRWGINRDHHAVAPGLYCVGKPDRESPVLVTANYKMSFDVLRKQMAGLNAWILVLDTRGINVWCAAGKNLFSTQEIVHRVKLARLSHLVNHRRIILPQLAATGVAAYRVKKDSGFKVIWGPIRARDIIRFLENGMHADQAMRRVTFSFMERLTLVPVELSALIKPTLWALLIIFIVSGVGSHIFTFSGAWSRGFMVAAAYAAGILAGALAAPVLLPWIPMRAFAAKGAITGLVGGIAVIFIFKASLNVWAAPALILITTAISSYLAMNFTGSTPFTSPSGVEKEMRKAIPLQLGAVVVAVVLWVGSAFVN